MIEVLDVEGQLPPPLTRPKTSSRALESCKWSCSLVPRQTPMTCVCMHIAPSVLLPGSFFEYSCAPTRALCEVRAYQAQPWWQLHVEQQVGATRRLKRAHIQRLTSCLLAAHPTSLRITISSGLTHIHTYHNLHHVGATCFFPSG